MYGKPIKRGDYHTYHLPNGYIFKLVLSAIFGIFVSLLLLWGFWQNNPVLNLEYLTMIAFVVFTCGFLIGMVFYVVFGISLTLSSRGGVFRCNGYRLEFAWDDVERIDYILNSSPKPSYQLSLILNGKQQVKQDKFQGWFIYSFIPIRFRFASVPVGVVFRRDIIGLDYRPPSRDEMLGFLEYFVTTPVGEDLLRYIPHIFRIPKHRYFDIPNESE